jgi:hypothetical protein
MVGVEVSTIFLFQKVVALFFAKLTGSPSVHALAGYLSTSSQSTRRTGLLASDDGELLPAIVI